MIAFVFTMDYEIYGNGEGSLKELVYEPTEKLINVFQKRNFRFVAFIEAAELEMIDGQGTDPAIKIVKNQIQNLYREGFEVGLHLHPQWYNARNKNGKWQLDYREYNLCTLPRERIVQIVEQSINYLRDVLVRPDFTPFSFRAGNWLFQPTQIAASVLAAHGIKVDSSVFKGGLQHRHKLDYRRALRNGYFWMFSDQVDSPDPKGFLLELPTYTKLVPFWRMLTAKRIGVRREGSSANKTSSGILHRFPDFLRFWYPLKLDFCRMTIDELTSIVEEVTREDQKDPTSFKPIVAIGHTKDLSDFDTVEAFLSYLEKKGIAVSTFEEIYSRCKEEAS